MVHLLVQTAYNMKLTSTLSALYVKPLLHLLEICQVSDINFKQMLNYVMCPPNIYSII